MLKFSLRTFFSVDSTLVFFLSLRKVDQQRQKLQEKDFWNFQEKLWAHFANLLNGNMASKSW